MKTIKTTDILLAFISVIVIGTVGYHFIEGWSYFDSLYMTVITITTVGYREIAPMSEVGQVFTMFMLIIGLGVAFLALSHLSTSFLKGELQSALGRKKMQNEIKKMKNHYILVGYGRTGQVIATHLKAKKIPFVVIDESAQVLANLESERIPFLQGEGSDESILKLAGIENAKGFIAVVSNDASNAFAIMTAKELNPHIYVVTRALDSQSVRKLKIAGAHKVIAPYALGGLRIAQAVTNPHAADFIDVIEDVQTRHIGLADFPVLSNSELDGVLINSDAVRKLGVIIIGIRKSDGEFVFHPSGNTKLAAQDHLVVIGPSSNLESISKTVSQNEIQK